MLLLHLLAALALARAMRLGVGPRGDAFTAGTGGPQRTRDSAPAAAVAPAPVAPTDADCPQCPPVPVPLSLPWFEPGRDAVSNEPGFTTTNSTRFKNRPLYGPYTGGLVLTGDRPISHLADDGAVYGGLLLGLRRGATALWAHDASSIESSFSGGAVRWTVRDDALLPGLQLRAAVWAAADGVGFVLDANVTDESGGGDGAAELVWAWGCGATSASAVGWARDPLVNSATLTWDFTPTDCHGNTVALGADNRSLTTTFADGARSVGVSLAVVAGGGGGGGGGGVVFNLEQAPADAWRNASALLALGRQQQPAAPAGALPVAGATLWLRASSLAATVANGSAVAAWADESGGGAAFAQADPALQPVFLADGLGAGAPAVRFDGAATFLASATAAVGAASTMFAVLRDDGSESDCCSGVLFFNSSCNGISTLTAHGDTDDDDGGHTAGGAPIVTILDYAGSAAYGHANIRGRAVVAASVYTPGGPSVSRVDGCVQATAPVGGTPSVGGALLGRRGTDVPRHFRGVLGEVVVFPRALNESELAAMEAYLFAAFPAVVPKHACTQSGPLALGTVAGALPPAAAAARFVWAVQAAAAAPPADPLAALAAAQGRAQRLAGRAASDTPSALIDAALPALSLAVDGLYRAAPGAFVHGAMAWDSLYLGWRSEYGATVLGATELVAHEGAYFMRQQITASPHTVCHSDPTRRLTDEAPDSRFHGAGRIDVAGSIYDMQSQFFDQQVHMWRWTGNVTHEALLRPALQLHVDWARDCFDGDGNGLYASYTNSWPTDSQFYSGGETWEETAYMLRAHAALRDMAARAGNASDAAAHAAVVARITAAAPQLWVAPLGLPASHREEGGHRRLRPDPWLASVFLPIEAGLWEPETAAQALFFTEWGLERDTVYCAADPAVSSAVCGEVVWNSNWIPAMWSLRQLWPGDLSALALAYFLTGLADDGYAVLNGTLHRDMRQSSVPGGAAAAQGGVDFNDIVHPHARALVEGLFGYRPDYVAGVVTVAPALPSDWRRASFAGAHVATQFASDLATTASLSVALTQPAPVLELRLPLRAGALLSLVVTGAPPGSTVTNATEPGFGESVLVVRVAAAAGGGAPVAAASLTVTFAAPLPCVPAVHAGGVAGAPLVLQPPAGLLLVNFSDPQGVLQPGSARIAAGGGSLAATLAPGAAAGGAIVFGYALTAAGGLPQRVMFKLNVAAVAPAPWQLPLPPPAEVRASAWAYVPLGAAANADLRDIFKEGTYVSPRPETCAVRLGSDGWSAWTFPYWGGPWAPQADFALVGNLTVAPGVIATPQGAQFLLGAAAAPPNAAMVTLWDAYPNATRVPVDAAAAAGATAAWVLLAGSTNPMQTRLANAVLRVRYADGSADALELVPPLNYWALSVWGAGGAAPGTRDGGDYDYATSAFCLPPTPPPTVQLGANNRAMVYRLPLRTAVLVTAVELEALSQEVVVALLGVSLSSPARA